MGKIIFIIGGARSGKSLYAINLAKTMSEKVVFLATGVACDEEMKERIEKHKEIRPNIWQTVEEPIEIEKVLNTLDSSVDCIIIDCLSFWVSNLLISLGKEKIINRTAQIIKMAKKITPKLIIVSNEVGMGIVPNTSEGRIFRDILGKVNQIVANLADEVFFLLSGIPIKLKGGSKSGRI
jgi:adenosylcobinamide kinase/adenosylcobinamide-phosphate guanylyltransferase